MLNFDSTLERYQFQEAVCVRGGVGVGARKWLTCMVKVKKKNSLLVVRFSNNEKSTQLDKALNLCAECQLSLFLTSSDQRNVFYLLSY